MNTSGSCRRPPLSPHNVPHLLHSFGRRDVALHSPLRQLQERHVRSRVVAKDLKSRAPLWPGHVRTIGNAWLADHHVARLEDPLAHVQHAVHHDLKAVAVVGVAREDLARRQAESNYRRWVILPFPQEEIGKSAPPPLQEGLELLRTIHPELRIVQRHEGHIYLLLFVGDKATRGETRSDCHAQIASSSIRGMPKALLP